MKFLKTAALSAAMIAGAVTAHATTYTIDSIINSSANGFGSSGFHEQTNGQMSGALNKFDSSVDPMGAWDTSIASGNNIYFSGDLLSGGSFTAKGRLNVSTTRTAGVEGNISFEVSGTSFDGIYDMLFRDMSHVTSGGSVIANGYTGTLAAGGSGVIGLWGDRNNFVNSATCNSASTFEASCLGIDLRLGFSEGGTFNEPEPVPLPASLGFLLLGLGGLAATKRRKA